MKVPACSTGSPTTATSFSCCPRYLPFWRPDVCIVDFCMVYNMTTQVLSYLVPALVSRRIESSDSSSEPASGLGLSGATCGWSPSLHCLCWGSSPVSWRLDVYLCYFLFPTVPFWAWSMACYFLLCASPPCTSKSRDHWSQESVPNLSRSFTCIVNLSLSPSVPVLPGLLESPSASRTLTGFILSLKCPHPTPTPSLQHRLIWLIPVTFRSRGGCSRHSEQIHSSPVPPQLGWPPPPTAHT